MAAMRAQAQIGEVGEIGRIDLVRHADDILWTRQHQRAVGVGLPVHE